MPSRKFPCPADDRLLLDRRHHAHGWTARLVRALAVLVVLVAVAPRVASAQQRTGTRAVARRGVVSGARLRPTRPRQTPAAATRARGGVRTRTTGAPARPVNAAQEEVSARIRGLADRTLQAIAVHDPITVTTTNAVRDAVTDARMPDASPRGQQRFIRSMRAIGRQLGEIDPATLSNEDYLTFGAIQAQVELAGNLSTRLYLSNVESLWDVHQAIAALGQEGGQPIANRADVDSLIARYHEVPTVLAQRAGALQRGARFGRVMPRVSNETVRHQLDAIIADPSQFSQVLATRPAGMTRREYTQARADLERVVATDVIPAFERYRSFLASAPTRETVGLSALPAVPEENLPDGRTAYTALLRYHTGTNVTPEQVHAQGLRTVRSLRRRIAVEAKTVLAGTAGTGSVLRRIAALPSQQPLTSQALEARVREDLAQGRTLLRPALGLGAADELPEVVRSLPPGALGSLAAYESGSIDASGKVVSRGTVMLDSGATVPVMDLKSLTAHEAIGHHGQWEAVARTPTHRLVKASMPLTAMTEGGAVYTEMLGREVGFYETPLERVGHYDEMMLRAVRMVGDTGLHAMGWSRERTVRYVMANTALDENAAGHEVDRWITNPGQATGYMSGALQIRDVRAQLARARGAAFDAPAFNRTVLSSASVPMQTFLRRVQGTPPAATH